MGTSAAHRSRACALPEDLLTPVLLALAGAVAAVNETLFDTPELVNSDPYGEAWFVRITPDEGASLDSLMDAAAYRAYTED